MLLFLNLQLFAFEGQNKKFTLNIKLLTCILSCDAGPGCLIRAVCKHSMLILITDIFFKLFIYLLQYSTVQYNTLLTILHYISLAANYIQYLRYLPYFPYIISLFPFLFFFFLFFCITFFNSLQHFINLQYCDKN